MMLHIEQYRPKHNLGFQTHSGAKYRMLESHQQRFQQWLSFQTLQKLDKTTSL
jgi:NOL1/NOP2/fmu family ribosome biogenesis protein